MLPRPHDRVEWNARFRADVPEYIAEQLREAAHQMRCTNIAVLLHLMAGHVDAAGRPLFYVREEDLIPDRRTVKR